MTDLINVLQTDNFDTWLKAYNTHVDLLNENFVVGLDGSDDYDADTLEVKSILRDKIATELRIELAGIFADSTYVQDLKGSWELQSTEVHELYSNSLACRELL